MEKLILFMVAIILPLSMVSAKGKPVEVLTPAPAPAPDYVNITHLLSVAGPFDTFLSYLQSTKVIDTFQNQANNTEQGITIFIPKDSAFSSLKNPSLKNLTADQLKSLCLFHAMPHFYSISDFKDLSNRNPVSTFAGGPYTLNFTDKSGTVYIDSEWTHTKVASSVLSTAPVALYEVSKVLLPVAIFGTDIPPAAAPAPAPVPVAEPVADSPSDAAKSPASSSDSSSDSSSRSSATDSSVASAWRSLILALLGGLAFFS